MNICLIQIFSFRSKKNPKARGGFILATNNISCWTNIVALLFGRQPNTNHISDYGDFGRFLQKNSICKNKNFRHRRIFSFVGLKEVLEFHGFKIITAKRCVFYPFPGIIEKILERIFSIYCAYNVFVCKK